MSQIEQRIADLEGQVAMLEAQAVGLEAGEGDSGRMPHPFPVPAELSGEADEVFHRFRPVPHAGSTTSVDISDGSWIRNEVELTQSASGIGSEAEPYIVATIDDLLVPTTLTITDEAAKPSGAEWDTKRLLSTLEYTSGKISRILRNQLGDINNCNRQWLQGAAYGRNYGRSIGNIYEEKVVDLDNKRLYRGAKGSETISIDWDGGTLYNALFEEMLEWIGSDPDVLLGKPSVPKNLDVTGVIKVAGTQVVTNRQAHVLDADGTLASVTAQFNELLTKLETHGLLAS